VIPLRAQLRTVDRCTSAYCLLSTICHMTPPRNSKSPCRTVLGNNLGVCYFSVIKLESINTSPVCGTSTLPSSHGRSPLETNESFYSYRRWPRALLQETQASGWRTCTVQWCGTKEIGQHRTDGAGLRPMQRKKDEMWQWPSGMPTMSPERAAVLYDGPSHGSAPRKRRDRSCREWVALLERASVGISAKIWSAATHGSCPCPCPGPSLHTDTDTNIQGLDIPAYHIFSFPHEFSPRCTVC